MGEEPAELTEMGERPTTLDGVREPARVGEE
jgi:hypothetical protein